MLGLKYFIVIADNFEKLFGFTKDRSEPYSIFYAFVSKI